MGKSILLTHLRGTGAKSQGTFCKNTRNSRRLTCFQISEVSPETIPGDDQSLVRNDKHNRHNPPAQVLPSVKEKINKNIHISVLCS